MKNSKKSQRIDRVNNGGSIPRGQIIVYTIAAILALAGLADATYLTVQFLSGETAVCGGSADCFKVLGSTYSKIGKVPVAALGVLGYFTVFTFAVFTAFAYARARQFFAITVWVMFAATLWFLFVQTFLLHAYCRYCLFSAAIIFLLTGLVVATPGARSSSSN
jgi:uncharacterized membrane protein